MNWRRISVQTLPEAVEAVSGVFYQLGLSNMEIEETVDQREAFLKEHPELWDYIDYSALLEQGDRCSVVCYLSENEAGRETLCQLREALERLKKEDMGLAMGSLALEERLMGEEEWADSWKRYFQPMKVGQSVLIQPAWEELPPTGREYVFFVNNSNIFGTGQHTSTQLCIEQLEYYLKPGAEVLDMGCGSGILSILALKMGAARACAVDIIANAEEIVRENALFNGINLERYEVLVGDVLQDEELQERMGYGKYDVVLANIVADVIIRLAELVFRQLKPGGVFISSGIIAERLEEVLETLEKADLQILHTKTENGWSVISAQKGAKDASF